MGHCQKEVNIKFKTTGTKFDRIYIMAHGAGAPMDSDWMNSLTNALVKKEIQVIRFEFPYMIERRETGKKRPPNTQKILLESWREAFQKVALKSNSIYIGGKSMGGRMASLIADELKPKGLVALGFPFHAPGKAPGERIVHLETIKTPTLIVQGTRDPMGKKDECLAYNLSKHIKFHWLEDGDHSWKPRKKSGFGLEEHIHSAATAIDHFMR
jgi:predicted alpha/beta-hydrolase family hydrolase